MFASRARRVLVVVVVTIVTGIVLAALWFAPPFQAPRVISIDPADNAAEILLTAPIRITFSAPMNRSDTESGVQLSPNVLGAFQWDDNQTLVFTPAAALPISTTLQIQIGDRARSWLGRPLTNPQRTQFTTLARPYVVAGTPALDAQFVYVPDELTVTFNRKLDANALGGALTLTPRPAKRTLEYRDRTLTIRGFFEPHTTYHLSIAGELTDAEYGIPFGAPVEWSFTAGLQYPNVSVLTRGRALTLPANQALLLPTQLTNVSRLDAALYPITPDEFTANETAPFETWFAFQPTAPLLRAWSAPTHAALDTYVQFDLPLDSLPAGNYLLKITSPERASDTKLLKLE